MENSNNTWRVALKYFCLSLLLLASVFCVAFAAVPAFAPSSAIKLYKNIGLNAAAVGVGERRYSKTNKIEDLYNLVVLCDEVDNSSKLLRYSNELLERSDFDKFAKAFDAYALNHTAKDKLYLVASLKNYLQEIVIECKYNKNREDALNYAVSCFDCDEIEIFYFEKYVSCILLDRNLSSVQKTQLLSELAAESTIYKGETILWHLKERYNHFKSEVNLEDSSILRLEQLFDIKSVEVVLLRAAESTELASAQAELENISTILEAKLNND